MPSALVMMGLGSFRFGLTQGGHQEARRSSSWRWEAIDRIGAPQGLQYLGAGADTLTLSGVIYPAFSGGLRQVDAMRAVAGAAVPLPMMMVDGSGFVWGRWVIVQVEDAKTYLLADGSPQKIEFSLTLEAYHK